MTYTPNVPQSGQTLGVSRPIINANFTVLDTTLSVNHVAMNASGAGKHKFVTLPAQGSTPSTAASTDIALYSATGTTAGTNTITVPWLAIQNGGTPYQLGNIPPLQAANGYSWLPGGMLLQWGSVAGTGTTNTITFPIAFTTIYQTIVTLSNFDRTYGVSAQTTTTATVSSSASLVGYTIRWVAIGVK